MTNEKAAEILELNIKEVGKQMPRDTLEALKKGAEALREKARADKEFPL